MILVNKNPIYISNSVHINTWWYDNPTYMLNSQFWSAPFEIEREMLLYAKVETDNAFLHVQMQCF